MTTKQKLYTYERKCRGCPLTLAAWTEGCRCLGCARRVRQRAKPYVSGLQQPDPLNAIARQMPADEPRSEWRAPVGLLLDYSPRYNITPLGRAMLKDGP